MINFLSFPKFSDSYLYISQIILVMVASSGNRSVISGQNYFQQEVNFTINVTLNDKLHELSGYEEVQYINNSGDTLNFLYFHLWPNAYSDNSTPLARQLMNIQGRQKLFNDNELKGYIDSLEFKVDKIPVKWEPAESPDICKVILNEPAKPGDTLLINTPFHVKIPKGVTSRFGYIGESYQISQWYPKPAVYDRSGWHQMPYLDQGEFYSEFGDYTVNITLPLNYIVGASGNLQNESEKQWLSKVASDTSWKINSHSISGFPISSNEQKTLTFKGGWIHDFAWFADKRFHVLTGEADLPYTSKKISTLVMFTDAQAELWKDALAYVNNSITYFSGLIGDYPYESYTAVQSSLSTGLGMEYPGITVIGPVRDAYELDEVIAHEVCHSWFYSAVGSNERDHPYMDESITSAYTARYTLEKYPEEKLWKIYFDNIKAARIFGIDKLPVSLLDELDWLIHARYNLEQPVNLSSAEFTSDSYNLMVYSKASIGFNYLRSFLGDSIFDKAMQRYYREWINKHPDPEDLRYILESSSGKDLTWFFHDFIETTERLDYKIKKLKGDNLLVKNNAHLKGPLVIAGIKDDSITFKKWINGFKGEKWIEIPPDDYKEIKIDHEHQMPEFMRLNNNIKKMGAFRKADPINAKINFTIEDPDKRSLMFLPLVNWKREDGIMLGMSVRSSTILPKPFEYTFVPFIALNNPEIDGFVRISYNITPWNSIIRKTQFTIEGTKFSSPGNQNYQVGKFRTDLFFRDQGNRNIFNHSVFGSYITASNLVMIKNGEKATFESYFQFGYSFSKNVTVNPFSINAMYEFNNGYQKPSLEVNYKFSYYRTNGMDVRLFSGIMIKNSTPYSFYSFSSGGRSGRELYLYDGTYPDRFSEFPMNFWSRQMTMSEGNLVTPVNDIIGYNRWVISLTVSSTLPGILSKIPVKPFANFLLNDGVPANNYSGDGVPAYNSSPFFFEGGMKGGIWNVIEIYVPLIVSGNILDLSSSLKNRIRLILNLQSVLNFKVD